jgi:hypothetical protein
MSRGGIWRSLGSPFSPRVALPSPRILTASGHPPFRLPGIAAEDAVDRDQLLTNVIALECMGRPFLRAQPLCASISRHEPNPRIPVNYTVHNADVLVGAADKQS